MNELSSPHFFLELQDEFYDRDFSGSSSELTIMTGRLLLSSYIWVISPTTSSLICSQEFI